jgi:hypothetical protein
MLYRRLAQTYMTFLECFAPSQNRRREAQEELLADLNTCIEQLNERMLEMEHRIERSHEQAVQHARMAKRAPTAAARSRDEQRARMHLRDRKRIQVELDKAQRMLHMLESHIDGIVSSHVDTLIVQTMRSYNHTATRLAMPSLTGQVEDLAEELVERNRELSELQTALSGVASSSMMAVGGDPADSLDGAAAANSDGALMLELEALLLDEAPSSSSSSQNHHHPAAAVAPSVLIAAARAQALLLEEEASPPLPAPPAPSAPSAPSSASAAASSAAAASAQQQQQQQQDDNADDVAVVREEEEGEAVVAARRLEREVAALVF